MLAAQLQTAKMAQAQILLTETDYPQFTLIRLWVTALC